MNYRNNINVLNIKADFDISLLKMGGLYSFMNLASLSSFFKSESSIKDINFFCDGYLMCLLINLFFKKKVKRVSFDFTSIADDVFNYIEERGLRLAIIGAEESELENFVNKIVSRYPKIKVVYYMNGYFNENNANIVFQNIIDHHVDVVVVGLGAGKQEKFLLKCRDHGFSGLAFTCGGFIRQESGTERNYYPLIFNVLGLRAFYRMYKEPHTIKRYFKDYPLNFFKFIFLFFKSRIKVEIN